MMTRIIKGNPYQADIVLADDEIRVLKRLAEEREAPKVNNPNAQDKRIIARDNALTHYIGIIVEYALSKVLGIGMDANAYVSGDRIKDFTVLGTTIEVKTLQGYLTFVHPEDFRADAAVLVNYNKHENPYKTLTVQGWTNKELFDEHSFWMTLVTGRGYACNP